MYIGTDIRVVSNPSVRIADSWLTNKSENSLDKLSWSLTFKSIVGHYVQSLLNLLYIIYKDGELMIRAFVLISTEMGSERDVLKVLKGMPEITEAYVVYGVYDIVAKIKIEDVSKLKEIISNNIRKIESVRSTLTMIVAEGFEKEKS